jgi:hypothetical protein
MKRTEISDVIMELGCLHSGGLMYNDNAPFKIQPVIRTNVQYD